MTETFTPAIENLKTCQRQLDMDGCEVGVSRQALDETLDVLSALYEALKAQEELAQRGLINTPIEEINRVKSMRRAALSKASGPEKATT